MSEYMAAKMDEQITGAVSENERLRAEIAAYRAALVELVGAFNAHRNVFLQTPAEPKIRAMKRMADAWTAARALVEQ